MEKLSSLSKVSWQIQILDPGSLAYRVQTRNCSTEVPFSKTMYSSPPLYMISLSTISVTFGPKYYMENSGNKKFTSFKLHIILSDLMKSPAFLLHTVWYVNHLFVRSILTLYSTSPLISKHLGCQMECVVSQSLCSSHPCNT